MDSNDVSFEISDSADDDHQNKDPAAVKVPISSGLGKRETQQARLLRSVVFLFVLSAVVVSCIFIWLLPRSSVESNTEGMYAESATKFTNDLQLLLENKILLAEDLRMSITSYAQFQGLVFPFVTVPNFHIAGVGSVGSESAAVAFSPKVTDQQRKQWETYAMNKIDWVEEEEQYFEETNDKARSLEAPDIVDGVSSQIYAIKDSEKVVAEDEDFYFPVWQNSPVSEEFINYNIGSSEQEGSIVSEVVLTKTTLIGPFVEVNENDQKNRIYIPVYDNLSSSQRQSGELVGILATTISWRKLLDEIAIAEDISMFTIIASDDCKAEYSFLVDENGAKFLGEGDHHDNTNNHLEVRASVFHIDEINESVKAFKGSQVVDSCNYYVKVYPTQEMLDENSAGFPIFVIVFLLCICIPVPISFCAYERAVSKRNVETMRHTSQADAIVASMFPAAVQERLFNGENDKDPEKGPEKALAAMPGVRASFLEMNGSNAMKPTPETVSDAHPNLDRPIADSFEAATILFGDIVGFTAWSSQREPGEVFTLLQTLYHAFDEIAHRLGVFKVETVGDCYVAATGIPEPQSDHAVRMARFAREIYDQMHLLTRQLEMTLGPDTGDLKMRIGMHSGPITGGVLRGEKARFQLFGDTMNMAARMESTGKRNKIQCSTATAELLIAADKSNWIEQREDLVQAKGKGEVQTFWLRLRDGGLNGDGSDDEDEFVVHAHEEDRWTHTKLVFDLPGKGDRYQRLVDWNVEVLTQLLKQIAASRRDGFRAPFRKNGTTPSMQQQAGSTARDEVKEVITLPNYDPKTEKSKVKPDAVELSPLVVNQLRDYVTTIASMYRNNPFHNFEHASHVTMSTNKLLKRIVEPHLHNWETTELSAFELHAYTYGITSDPLTQFALLFCALIHDVDHAGVSNFQLIAENATIAKLYKNQSVAEQNSVDLSWDLLMDPTYKDLQKAIYSDEADMKRFRQLVVNIVLATDIFDKDMKNIRETRWSKAFQYDESDDEEEEKQEVPVTIENYEDRVRIGPLSHLDGMNLKATIVLEHLIQASDVAHTMQHWDIYLKWNERLFREMYSAFDAGRAGRCPAENWYEGEIMFFDKYIIPLARKLDECGVFGVSSDEYLSYALANRKQWAVQGDEVVEEFVRRYQEVSGSNKTK